LGHHKADARRFTKQIIARNTAFCESPNSALRGSTTYTQIADFTVELGRASAICRGLELRPPSPRTRLQTPSASKGFHLVDSQA
jgi:hypothetical protein